MRAIPGHIGHLREDSGIGGIVAVSGSGRLPGGVVTLGRISSALLHEAPNISGGRLASLGAGTTSPSLCSLNVARIAVIILISGPKTHREAGKSEGARIPQPPGVRNHTVLG